MSTNVKTVAILTARSDQSDRLHALLTEMAPHCRAEPGNLRWDVWRDGSDATRYVLDELYVDDAAVAAHRRSPHYKAYAAQVPDLATRQAVTCDAVDVAMPER